MSEPLQCIGRNLVEGTWGCEDLPCRMAANAVTGLCPRHEWLKREEEERMAPIIAAVEGVEL